MPANEMDYWSNGFPYGGVDDGTNAKGEMNFWDNGFPYIYLFPPTTPTGTPRSYGFIIG